MIEDKVDQDIMTAIDEDTLSRYIPHLGDRVFARNWTSGERNEERKRILVDQLRSKMRLSSTSGPAPTATQSRNRIGVGNRNAESDTRKTEVGWMNYHNGVMKQVRRPTGGGTREIIVRKSDTMKKKYLRMQRCFSLMGNPQKDIWTNLNSHSVMGSGEPLEDTLSVASVCDTTRHKLLRLYVCSKRKHAETSTNLNATPESPHQDSSLAESTCTTASKTSTPDSLSPHAFSSTISQLSPIMPAPVSEIGQLVSTSSPPIPACVIPHSNEEDEEVIFVGDPRNVSCDDTNDTLMYDPQITPLPAFDNLLTNLLADNVVDGTSDANSTSFFENPDNVAEKQLLTIRSAHCITDMINAFSDPNILDANITFQRVLENGDIENGVPTLHHAYKEREWEAVARIVAFGWKYRYLPVQLARPFLLEAFSINPSTSSSTLMEAFLNYISPNEKDALTDALNDFHNADFDELLTILGSHSCPTLPTEQNLAKLLDEIVHKELVQEPAFIIKC
ncbi:uncharacterized protein LOC117504121 [Thalassophryne amazonica]|uniref:uncharacterized protein LOC117504121 n=1 Tax=Thalassophryne amazonica TaxID=390379 RepID=UPI001471135E|nr:uncharacterized protein LOC117504121 [Thalassophryne amazonica]